MIGLMARRISSPVIVGRDDELALLRATVARGAAGEPETVLVSGEAGVGKSRLVAQLAAEADELGVRVVVGGCVALVDAPLPYAPVAAAIDGLLRDVDDATLGVLTAGIAGDLARLSPDVGARVGDAQPVAVPEAMIPGRVFDAVRLLLGRAAMTLPLVVVFEDLHWADPSSLDLIGYLIRNGDWPGAIVATYRSDELHRRHPILPWLAEIARLASVERIELDRLSPNAIADQVEAILGEVPDARLIDEVVHRGGGNAFITEELVASRERDGGIPRAAGVKQLLLARVAGLSDATRTAVEAMSVSPGATDVAIVAAASDRPETEVEAAIHEALDGQVLVAAADGSGYVFRHALLQEAVYDELLPSERRRYHLGFARSLEATHGPEAVHHALAANDLALALRTSIAAGTAASGAGAFVDAATHLERAVELFDAVPHAQDLTEGGRSRLLVLAAQAASFSGDSERGLRLWRAALDAAGQEVSIEERAEILLGLAIDANDTFENDAALEATRAANELLMTSPPSRLRARAVADMARDLFVVNESAAAVEASQAAIEMASGIGDLRTEALARGRLSLGLVRLGHQEEGIAEAEAALSIARATRDRFVVMSVFSNAGWLFDEIGQQGRAGDLLIGEAVPLARELGLPTASLTTQGAWYLWQVGRWSEGRLALDEAFHIAGIRSGRGRELAVAQDLYDVMMRPAVLRAEASEPIDDDGAAPLIIATENAIRHGETERALALARRGLEAGQRAADASGDRSLRGWFLRLIARAEADVAASSTGHRQEARRLAAARRSAEAAVEAGDLLKAGHRVDLYGGDMPANVALAEAEATRAAGSSDPDAWASAAKAWESRDGIFEAAYARYRRAEALLSAGGRRAEAADDLRWAKRTTVTLGAAPLEADIDALAARARIDLGPSSASGAPDPASPLTRRELEVLALLAEGRSNRQIAETLFISESTAGVHVSNILGKLGVSGRTEAAAVAFRAGLVSPAGEVPA